MARPKGTKNPNAGRKKGTPNKDKQALRERLAAMGCDPIDGMAKIAQEAMSEKDYPLAGNMFKELARYTYPALKAIELSSNPEQPVELVFKWESE